MYTKNDISKQLPIILMKTASSVSMS